MTFFIFLRVLPSFPSPIYSDGNSHKIQTLYVLIQPYEKKTQKGIQGCI